MGMFSMALRNATRAKRRSGFIFVALALSSAGFVIYANMIRGFYFGLIDEVVAMQAADALARHPRWLEEAKPQYSFDSRANWTQGLEDLPGVKAVTRRMEVPSFLNSSQGGRPVLALGVEPSVEKRVSSMTRKLETGRYLSDGDHHAAVIGSTLAERLGLELGSRLVLMASDESGEVQSHFVELVGVFKLGGELGAALVHVPLALSQNLAGRPSGHATQLGLSREVGASRSSLVSALSHRAPEALEILPWTRALPQLASFLRGDLAGMVLIMSILIAVVSLGVWNVVLMSVQARKHEFGVMAAVGMSPAKIRGLVLWETAILGTVSVAFGLGLGALLQGYFAAHGISTMPGGASEVEMAGFMVSTVAYPEWYPKAVALALGSLWTLSILAGLPPALRAARSDPKEALEGLP